MSPSGPAGLGGAEGDPSQNAPVNIQKSKPLSVWDALEKVVKNKNGQSPNKMVKSQDNN
jgi:hypothetical protein